MSTEQRSAPRVGLILAGGGARAAYQVGVLKAICALSGKRQRSPFPIICGTSAGAINGAVIANHADRFTLGVRRLVRVWRNFSVDQVFRADTLGVAKSGGHWLAALMLGGLGKYNPNALLDREPLRRLLEARVRCDCIEANINKGALHAFSVSASGYSSAQSVTFFQGASEIQPWNRARRIGIPATITIDHLMASSAIPFVFEAVRLHREYFGDGSMRQLAPISPALHLGADRVMVIGVRRDGYVAPPREKNPDYPSLAQMAGYVLDSLFLDSLETDLERLRRINKTISLVPQHHLTEGKTSLKPVEALVISPSDDITQIAARHMREFPFALKLLLRGVGAINRNGSNLVSYLLFDKGYCRELIDLGYHDTMERRKEVVDFLGLDRGD